MFINNKATQTIVVPKKVQRNLKRLSKFTSKIKIVPYSDLQLGSSDINIKKSNHKPKIIRIF